MEKRIRGKRGVLRPIEVTIRFDSSYANSTIAKLLSAALTGSYVPRIDVVEGDRIETGFTRPSMAEVTKDARR